MADGQTDDNLVAAINPANIDAGDIETNKTNKNPVLADKEMYDAVPGNS